MTPKEYQEQSAKTDLDRDGYDWIAQRSNNPIELLHYCLGLGTETGELQDALKKHIMYGKELDRVNLIEEAGDCVWYLSQLLTYLGSSFEEAMEINIKKLRARYGEKFTQEAALNRNLEAERKILEGK